MYDPTIGRWLEQDPIGFDAGDMNLYRMEGNNPTNEVDPSGLEGDSIFDAYIAYARCMLGMPASAPSTPARPSVAFTVAPQKGYDGFSREVADPYAIVFDTLLSGSPDEAVRRMASPLLGGAFEPKTFYGAMEAFCQKTYGKGWKPVPVEFRLTGLRFYPLGGLAQPPRTGTAEIPVLIKKDGGETEFKKYEAKDVPLAHFFIEGFWVFKCTDGKKESPLYGIPTEGKVHTWVHSPYDNKFLEKMKEVRNLGAPVIGRPYDRRATGMSETALKQFGGPLKYLKVAPGDKGKDLKIVKLSDIWDRFEFPE